MVFETLDVSSVSDGEIHHCGIVAVYYFVNKPTGLLHDGENALDQNNPNLVFFGVLFSLYHAISVWACLQNSTVLLSRYCFQPVYGDGGSARGSLFSLWPSALDWSELFW